MTMGLIEGVKRHRFLPRICCWLIVNLYILPATGQAIDGKPSAVNSNKPTSVAGQSNISHHQNNDTKSANTFSDSPIHHLIIKDNLLIAKMKNRIKTIKASNKKPYDISIKPLMEDFVYKNYRIGSINEIRLGYNPDKKHSNIPLLEITGQYSADALRAGTSMGKDTLRQIKAHPYKLSIRALPDILVFKNLSLHALVGIDFMHLIAPVTSQQFHVWGGSLGAAIEYRFNNQLSIRLDGAAVILARNNHNAHLMRSVGLNHIFFPRIALQVEYYPSEKLS